MDPKELMQAALKAAREIASKAEAEHRELSADEVADAAKHLKAYEDAKADFQRGKQSDDVKSALAAIGLELGLEQNSGAPAAETFKARAKGLTLGRQFVDSTEYKAFMAQFSEGHIQEKARVQSLPFGVKSLITGASDTSAGAFVSTDVTDILELLGRRPLTLRDMISVRQTGSDTVEFVQQTTQPTSAAPVAEATTSADPTVESVTTFASPDYTTTSTVIRAAGGGYKPEGSIAFLKVTATVKTIAEWIPATKRGIADAAQLRGIIDDELLADLKEEEEDQILNGSGVGENLTGILETSGIQMQAWSATVAGLDPMLETTRKAKTKVRTVGRALPTAYLLNPADWEKIELARLAKNPANEGAGVTVPTLHGLPVIESEGIAAGVGLVGDFRKAVLWDREQASVSITDSHSDFFIRNLVAILAEERVAFGVTRPTAFVEIDLTV